MLSVHVAIRAADASIIEEGEAELHAGSWTYTATTTLPAGQPVTIEATAMDRAKNKANATAPFPSAA